MDARLFRLAALAPALWLLAVPPSQGATFSTQNFVVTAADPDFARQVAQMAERCRVQLAHDWLGHELPRWFRPCQVSVTVGQIGAGGATTFTFAAGQVFGWEMRVQGTPERILDSVIPHEVSHTIFASYFRRPLPRWADEGAASLVEHESERRRQSLLLHQVFNTPQRIPLTTLISMKEYPRDMQSVLTLYAEGYSLADYLVQSGGETGRARYLRFLQDAHERDWNHAIRTWYGLPDVTSLERRWSNWVIAGSPDLRDADNAQLAQADAQAMRKKGIIVRSQSPDNSPPAYEKTQSSRAARPAEPRGPDENSEAPDPVRRTAQNVDGAARMSQGAVADDQALARRREGRQRMLQEGWGPAENRASDNRTASSENRTADEDTVRGKQADESSPRRRFRRMREERDADSAAGLRENEDPFAPAGQAGRIAGQQDLSEAETPFHTEN